MPSVTSNDKLWRSIDQREQSADYLLSKAQHTPTGPEDPIGSGENRGALDRRGFMKLMGASIGLATATGCRRPVEHIVPYVNQPEEFIPGRPVYFASTISRGEDAIGVLVESHEGRPTKIEPNPEHPGSQGGVSAIDLAEILGLYDPDRSKHFMQGEKTLAWADVVAEFAKITAAHKGAGAGLAVLCEERNSPAMAALAEKFAEGFPSSTWVNWSPVNNENAYAGIAAATGSALRAVPDFAAAKVVLALDCDFLMGETSSVSNTRGFCDARRVEKPGDQMNRLYSLEGNFSVTGGMADHRLRVRPSEVGAISASIAAAAGVAGVKSMHAGDPAWISAAVADLKAAGKDALVVAGRKQPPAVHAIAAAMNAALGSVGTTVSYIDPTDAGLSSTPALATLCETLLGGSIDTLIVLGGNPVYDAPADLLFPKAMLKAATRVFVGSNESETGVLANLRIPQSSFLESWDAARAVDGTISIVQPLIAPLYDSKSSLEIVHLLLNGEKTVSVKEIVNNRPTGAKLKKPVGGHEIVRAALSSVITNDGAWRKALHDGVVANTALAPATATVDSAKLGNFVSSHALKPTTGMEIAFEPCPKVYDGRYANNGWLQELPDPVTKSVWGNSAMISPATAKENHVNRDDLVSLTVDGRELKLPVFILPGHADGLVTVYLGYGRRDGAIAKLSGSNAFQVRASKHMHYGLVDVKPAKGTLRVASTQDHHHVDGNEFLEGAAGKRALIREATVEEYREGDKKAGKMHDRKHAMDKAFKPNLHAPHVPNDSLWAEHKYESSPQWAMAIDLNTCTGCNACVTACQSENNIPIVGKENADYGREMHWIRVDRYFKGGDDNPKMRVQPVPCMQCEQAPCEQVCPVGATTHTPDGLNAMVYNRCIGTRYCSNNCPYKVRRFNFFNFTNDGPETYVRDSDQDTEIQKMSQNPDVSVRFRGVMEKCTYCTQRINQAKIDAKVNGEKDGVPPEGSFQTACQQACPAGAIEFGNIIDQHSAISKQKANDRNYVLLDEFHFRPRTSYLAKVTNPNPALVEWEAAHFGGADDSHGHDDGHGH
ncbi:MAG: Fe-S-cluster-containing dehydrogenase component [Rhodothermales bacterium]|jgi:Fe-S-cluster-containing dehydrogenase component